MTLRRTASASSAICNGPSNPSRFFSLVPQTNSATNTFLLCDSLPLWILQECQGTKHVNEARREARVPDHYQHTPNRSARLLRCLRATLEPRQCRVLPCYATTSAPAGAVRPTEGLRRRRWGIQVGPRDSRAILRLLCGPLSTEASSSGMRDVRAASIRLFSRFASHSWSSCRRRYSTWSSRLRV